MHEMTLALSLLHIACEEAARHGVARLNRVDVQVGVFVAIEPHALVAAFELAAEYTPAEGAELVIERVPAKAVCQDCRHRFELENPRSACPVCGSVRLSISGGRECRIVGLAAPDPVPSGSN